MLLTPVPTQLFRDINVILVGDFHQFPLPDWEDLALFNRRPPTNAAAIGCAIFEQLETVRRDHSMIRDEDEREEYVRTRKYMNMYNNPILAVAQPQRSLC